jgi:hypothetical protein
MSTEMPKYGGFEIGKLITCTSVYYEESGSSSITIFFANVGAVTHESKKEAIADLEATLNSAVTNNKDEISVAGRHLSNHNMFFLSPKAKADLERLISELKKS